MAAIEDGKLKYASASQITHHGNCPKSWAYNYVLGQRKPQTAPQKKGEMVHKGLEDHFKSLGKEPLTHKSAILLLKLFGGNQLPLPAENILIEYPSDRKLNIQAAGVNLEGRIDMMRPGQRVEIYDFKTSSNFSYNKSADQLVEDIQMTVYGRYAFERMNAKEVTYSHAYVGTKAEEAEVVTTQALTRDVVDTSFRKVEEGVRGILKTLAKATEEGIEKVEGNLGFCKAFGGCPYQSECSTYKASLTSALVHPNMRYEIKGDGMGLKALMNKTRATGINPPDATPHDLNSQEEVTEVNTPVLTTDTTLSLFINAAPEGVQYVRLEKLIEQYSAPICKTAGVSDVRSIAYGAGKTALLDAFRKNPPKGLVAATAGGLSLDVLEVLVPMASLIVRGV